MAERGARSEGSEKRDLLISWVGVGAFTTGIVLAAWRVSQDPSWLDRQLVSFLVAGGAGLVTVSVFITWVLRRVRALAEDVDPLVSRVRAVRKELDIYEVHQSIHHLFSDRDLLRPRGGGNVDMVLDAADLPSTLTDYLRDIHAAGAKARILLLDPSSSLTERHRFVQQAEGDASAAAQHFGAKINEVIEELAPLATIRLFDAVPPGNLIIVDDHIFWGGIPSVPSDAPFPIIGITADTREHVYWAFRRNFDVLWKQAKPIDANPIDAIAPRATRSIAAASL